MTGTRHQVVRTALGDLDVVVDDVGLAGLYFPGHWTRPDPAAWGPRVQDDPEVAEVADQLAAYLAGERRTFDLPLSLAAAPRASERALRLWGLLAEIPYGETTTYGALAAAVGGHARSVGGLVGANPVSVVVPCHRVVGASGSLTGYAGGLERKRHLLTLEGALAQTGLW